MATFNEPSKWATTLGQDADVVIIPDTASDTDPSIDKIFPSVFSIPLAQGGRAIPRSVLNGLFKLLGDWIYYIQNGGVASYSATLDYAVGSLVKYNNDFYRCIQANGASTTVKAPTDIAYWSKITTLADVVNAFANRDLSNLTANGQAIIDNKADISFSNVNNTANILMAHNAMPSGQVFDDLTLGATGSSYTAPADGYFCIGKATNGTSQYITLSSATAMTTSAPVSGVTIKAFIVCKKGQQCTVDYTAGGALSYFRFMYAVGSQSEQ